MNVITKSAALAVAASALAAPILLATAGAADAAPSPAYRGGGAITVHYQEGPAGLGVNASIWDDANPDGVVEVCQYTSAGTNGELPFSGTAVMTGRGPAIVHIPGGPLGQQWNVSVHCSGTGQTANFQVNY
jgi:hypothetical protein